LEQRSAHSAPSVFLDVHHAPEQADRKARLIAGLLTSVLYVLFAVLIWRSFLTVPVSPAPPEIVAEVLPNVPKKQLPLPRPLPIHLVRPHRESVIMPTFTVASAKSLAPALLPPTAAEASLIAGGGASRQGSGTEGGSGSGDNPPDACLDPLWAHAVTRRVTSVLDRIGYPKSGRGRVIVHFVVRSGGQLDLVEVSRSSGNEVLDGAAYNAMRASDPLPPIPNSMHTDRIDEQYEFDFGERPLGPRTFKICGGGDATM